MYIMRYFILFEELVVVMVAEVAVGAGILLC